jgi:hypothetical protein
VCSSCMNSGWWYHPAIGINGKEQWMSAKILSIELCHEIWGPGYKTNPEYIESMRQIDHGRDPSLVNADLEKRLRDRSLSASTAARPEGYRVPSDGW